MTTTSRRELFGGAITMDLPSNFIDASDFRQVPDTQEVFLDPESDISVIVDILQRVDAEDAKGAVMFHFYSLAEDNSANSQQIFDVVLPAESRTTPPSETPHPIILYGEQTVPKFNSTIPDRVYLSVALFRIEVKGVDLVLTVNIPTFVAKDSRPGDDALLQISRQKFDLIAGSLKILDFDLFA